MVYFEQIMHHSAGNDQFAFQIFLLAPNTDLSTFVTGRAHYGQLILNLMIVSYSWVIKIALEFEFSCKVAKYHFLDSYNPIYRSSCMKLKHMGVCFLSLGQCK